MTLYHFKSDLLIWALFDAYHTTKGKGVSFMEDNYAWHGSAPNQEQYEQAMEELGGLE